MRFKNYVTSCLLRVGRKSKSDYDYNGITIPKNANVYVPIVLIHMDPENWPEPDKFDPLRYIR